MAVKVKHPSPALHLSLFRSLSLSLCLSLSLSLSLSEYLCLSLSSLSSSLSPPLSLSASLSVYRFSPLSSKPQKSCVLPSFAVLSACETWFSSSITMILITFYLALYIVQLFYLYFFPTPNHLQAYSFCSYFLQF